jgi:PRC-barrel domain
MSTRSPHTQICVIPGQRYQVNTSSMTEIPLERAQYLGKLLTACKAWREALIPGTSSATWPTTKAVLEALAKLDAEPCPHERRWRVYRIPAAGLPPIEECAHCATVLGASFTASGPAGTSGRYAEGLEASMTTQPRTTYDAWVNQNVYDLNGDKIGEIDEIFYDDVTGRPEWVTVKSGFFGTKRHFVPIMGSSTWEDGIKVNYTKDMVSDAPGVSADYGHLDVAEEQMLYRHYNIDWTDTTDTAFRSTPRADTGYTSTYNRSDYDTRGRLVETTGTTGTQAVETEEMKVRSERPEIVAQEGTVRLRKYRHTEMVPVTKEEVRVEKDADVDVDDTTTRTGRTTR